MYIERTLEYCICSFVDFLEVYTVVLSLVQAFRLCRTVIRNISSKYMTEGGSPVSIRNYMQYRLDVGWSFDAEVLPEQ